MRNKLFCILSFVSICFVFSCTREALHLEEEVSSGIVNYISVNLPDPGEMDTRSTFVIDNTGVHVFWADKDTIGIFPSSGDQVSFPMISGAGSTSANFDGGSWGLKDNNTYSAYYPFNRKYFSSSHNAVRLTWEGQIQSGNNNGSHLGSFDYLASGASSPKGQYLNINFIRLGSIACFRVLAPQPGKYTKAIIRTDADIVLEADLDVTGESPVVTPVKTAHEISLGLENVTTSTANETVTLYMMMCPVDFTGHSVSISLIGEEESAFANLPEKNMAAGKPYMFNAGENSRAISFKDPIVDRICVSDWDQNGNGLIEYEEAANVTDLGNVFQRQKISSFDELRFFTSLTSIPENAFEGCQSLKSITIPEGVSRIGSGAFRNCLSLESISIPSSVTEIQSYALENCSSLEELALPEALENLGDYALSGLSSVKSIDLPENMSVGQGVFKGWKSLISIEIPSNWTELTNEAFKDCSSISEIIVPDNIIRLGDSCFCGCRSLTSISLPVGLESLMSYAFQDCSSLESIRIPENAVIDKSRGNYALFKGCASLKEVSIPSSWRELGDDYFNGCSGLESFTVPDGIARVGGRCFSGCVSLLSVDLPESLLAIDELCFWGCISLKSVEIPGKIKFLDQGIFNGCSSLESVILPEGLVAIGSKTDTEGPLGNCTSLKTIVIPESVTFIGTYAFCGSGLESIHLPDNISFIGTAAFERCPIREMTLPANLSILNSGVVASGSLSTLTIPANVHTIIDLFPGNVDSITLLGTTPPDYLDLSGIPDNGCPIFVPSEAVEAYRSAPGWCEYASRIQAISSSGGENPDPGSWS